MNEKDHSSLFDTQAADRERLAWRTGGELPTERASGRDEALARETAEQVDVARAERQAARSRLKQRLGTIASGELSLNDN